ncbi:MAG TPA: F0F1 ATP synthase subunit A [Anaeromyxobacter sp.]
MITATLVTLALRAILASTEPAHAEHAAAAEAPANGAVAPAPAPEAHGDAAPVGHESFHGGALQGGAHAEAGHAEAGHGEAGGHGGGHDESLGPVMMHHVVDGYEIEHPGLCGDAGGFRWNCTWDLRSTFGDTFKFGALDMTPTKHVIMMWAASALLLLVVFGGLRKKALVPRGLYAFVETLVQFVRNELAIANIGKSHADRFVPYLLTAFFFILFVNLFGLIPFMGTATANVNVTLALALFTFFITQYAAIRQIGIGGYLAHLTGGVPKSLWPLWAIMIPVEFLGLFTKPFALTVRLFANMVAGHFVILALLGLIFAISVWVFPVSMALALAIFLLELFVAFVQAYIFTMLSSLFIGAAFASHGHEEAHGEHGHGEARAHAAEH